MLTRDTTHMLYIVHVISVNYLHLHVNLHVTLHVQHQQQHYSGFYAPLFFVIIVCMYNVHVHVHVCTGFSSFSLFILLFSNWKTDGYIVINTVNLLNGYCRDLESGRKKNNPKSVFLSFQSFFFFFVVVVLCWDLATTGPIPLYFFFKIYHNLIYTSTSDFNRI